MPMRPRRITLYLLSIPLLLGGCSSAVKERAHSPATVPDSRQSEHRATAIATRMLGKPYRYGGASPKGFDCSGLVYYAYHQAGYRIPRTSQQQYRDSLPVKRAHIREGDLLFFRIEGKVSHVGVYLGDNRFIHAPANGKRVTIASLDNPYWKQRLTKTGRFF
jgi:cell wall-associated NlpC family hydrolase